MSNLAIQALLCSVMAGLQNLTKIMTTQENHPHHLERIIPELKYKVFFSLFVFKKKSHFHCIWSPLLLKVSMHIGSTLGRFYSLVEPSCWCKASSHTFICHWGSFVLIQDCTIFKKSIQWRQCNIMQNIST